MSSIMGYLSQHITEAVNMGTTDNFPMIMNYMLKLMAHDVDLSNLAGNVVKLLPLPYLPLKKVLCSYLIKYSKNISDLNILSTNSLLKDFSDSNPYVRALVLRTVSCIPSLRDLATDLLPKALTDSSAYVRRTAVNCCLSILDSSVDMNSSIINQLYHMIRDSDPTVMVSCVVVLEALLKQEGGIVINYKMAQYLITRMSLLPQWSLIGICGVLKKYIPKDQDEIIYFLNILDDKLNSRNPVVCIPVLQMLLHFVKSCNEILEKSLVQCMADQLLSLSLQSDCTNEILFTVMELMEELLLKYKNALPKTRYKHLFCHFKNPDYVKVKKLTILPLLLDSNNASDILREMLLYFTSSKEVCKQAIIGFVLVLSSGLVECNPHVQTLSYFMSLDRDNLIDETVQCLVTIDLDKLCSGKHQLLFAINEQFHKIRTKCGKEALLSLIGHYGNDMESATYILEHLFNQEKTVDDIYSTVLLRSAVKLFLLRPAEMQLLLGEIFQKYTNSSSLLVRHQAFFYYYLFQMNPILVKEIMKIKNK